MHLALSQGERFLKGFLIIVLLLCLYSQAFAEEEALFGTAAILGAASPMVMSGIQAAADRDIARINAQTSIATTQIGSNTAMYLAQLQAQTAFSQIQATASINALNQYGVTDRLSMQLNELSSARRDNLLMEREKLGMEWALNQQRMGLAYKQADDNALLGRLTLNAQLVQSGLGSSLGNIVPSTTLAVSRVFQARQINTVPSRYSAFAFKGIGNRKSLRIPLEVGGSSWNRAIKLVEKNSKPSDNHFLRRDIAGTWGHRRVVEEYAEFRTTHRR